MSIVWTAKAQYPISDKDLDMLDKELMKVEEYDKIKYARIDSIKQVFNKAKGTYSQKIDAALKIGREYESFITDSAVVYYETGMKIAKQAGDSLKFMEARIGRMKVFGVSGLYKEAATELEEIEKLEIPEELKTLWYDSCRQLFVYMIIYTENNPAYSKKYFDMNNKYRIELLNSLDPGSEFYRFNEAELLQSQGENKKAKRMLMELIDEINPDSWVYARATSGIATIEMQEGNKDVAARYLVLSAISDIKSSIKENSSIQNLAVYLYSSGDIDRAYKYICVSLEDANFCNARLRSMQISRNMPLIDSAYKSQINKQKDRILVILVLVSLLSVCLIIAIILGLHQMRKLSEARMHLKIANRTKEEYIGHFLDLCSIYMERLDNFCKVVTRKVSTGQLEDLIKMTKSPKFAEEQHKKFYENFDSAFLHIYPAFVEQFNQLLIPEERISIKDGKLTTELRIFAFLRMGVDDSTKIASFLHYSVNTIYTYRNKMRNKALNRDTFEKDVMQIGTPE